MFLATSEVVELYDLPIGRGVVVGQYAAVCILALPQVLPAVHAALSLY